MSKLEPFLDKVRTTVDPAETLEVWTQIKELKESDGSPTEFADLICACLTNPNLNIFRSASTLLSLVKWKKFPDGISKITDHLLIKPDTKHLELEDSKSKSNANETYNQLSTFAESLKEICANDLKPNEPLSRKWCTFIMKTMTDWHKWYSTIMRNVVGSVENWTIVDISVIENFLKTLLKFIKDNPDPQWHSDRQTFILVYRCYLKLLQALKTDEKYRTCFDIVHQLLCTVQDKDLVIAKNLNFFGQVFSVSLLLMYPNIAAKIWKMEYLKKFLPIILQWHDKDEDDLEKKEAEDIKKHCDSLVQYLYTNEPNYLRDSDIEHYCKLTLEQYNYQTMQSLRLCYENGNESIKNLIEKYTKDLLQFFADGQDQYQTTSQILSAIFKSNPKLINSDSVDKIEMGLHGENANINTFTLIRGLVALKRNEFKNRGDSYFDVARRLDVDDNMCTILVIYVLQQIAFIDKENAERVVAMYETEMKLYKEKPNMLVNFFSSMYSLTSSFPESFRKRLPWLESYKQIDQVKVMAQGMIDIVEGRSLQKVSDDVEQQGKDIKVLDEEVGKTKKDVDKLDKRVDQHDTDIRENRDNIANTQNDLNQLGGRVDKAEDKIDDIDNKTVSNAPSWSKEVSKLLNPRANNDWTLLAQRLNYNSSDIRGWASQPDPTMSLLAEFYTTNKTSDATKYLLKVLKDTDRLDVVTIIEKHQKQNENIVADDDTGYKIPPTVFISYQWNVQTNVKLLKDRIEKEGYTCWMDLGQMGGGDMLYEKIDNGIRCAKIVILCMTDLYCKSANCIREVNLANGLDKLIVPLVFEKELNWPPPGSMGPILAGKLFIRFFQRDTEKTNDERYWPPDKYNELMDKIKGAVGPPHSQVVATASESFASNAPPTIKKSYKLCISCSPDKVPTMKTLQRDLQAAGFETKLCCYIEDSVANYQAQVYICAICLRYAKSSLAVNEMESIQSQNKSMIILMFDREYPPMGPLKKHLSKLSPVNCTYSNPNTGSVQFQKIVELINTYSSVGYKQQSDSNLRRQSLPNSSDSDSSSTRAVRPATASKNSFRRSDSDDRGNSNGRTNPNSEVPKLSRRISNQRNVQQSYNNGRKMSKRSSQDDEPTYYNPDGPKLPSLYKQRLNNRY